MLRGSHANEAGKRRLPSTAKKAAPSKHVEQLVLPVAERPAMPLTKSKYIVKEPPALVAWERELRTFLRKLSPQHEHRVSAAMVYEWATGIKIADLVAGGGSANGPLRHLNRLLKEYFGQPYMTWIAGRKVPRAYKVPAGYLITRRRPKTMTLWVEWSEGSMPNP